LGLDERDLEIIQLLRSGPKRAIDMEKILVKKKKAMSRRTFYNRLKKLLEEGIIEKERTYYRLSQKTLENPREVMFAFLKELERWGRLVPKREYYEAIKEFVREEVKKLYESMPRVKLLSNIYGLLALAKYEYSDLFIGGSIPHEARNLALRIFDELNYIFIDEIFNIAKKNPREIIEILSSKEKFEEFLTNTMKNFSIVYYANGEKALEIIRKHADFSDLSLMFMDPKEIEKLRKRELSVVAIYNPQNIHDLLIGNPVVLIVEKEKNKESFLDKIRKHVRGRHGKIEDMFAFLREMINKKEKEIEKYEQRLLEVRRELIKLKAYALEALLKEFIEGKVKI